MHQTKHVRIERRLHRACRVRDAHGGLGPPRRHAGLRRYYPQLLRLLLLLRRYSLQRIRYPFQRCRDPLFHSVLLCFAGHTKTPTANQRWGSSTYLAERCP